MDKLTKPKEKSSSLELVRSTEYAFVSPYSMDECITHLNALEAKYRKESFSFWKGTSLEFNSITDNGGVVQFEIGATAIKQTIEVKSIGQLIYKDHNRTLVRMQIGVTRQSLIWDLLISAGICVVFVLAYQSIIGLVSVVFVDAIIHLITYTTFLMLKSELRASVYEALSISKAPRPQTLPP